jgi:hypothetical protein
VIPSGEPLDDSVTAAPGRPTTFDLLDYATGWAAAAGLQLPLQLVGVTQPDLPGSTAAISQPDPTIHPVVAYSNQVIAAPGQHPVDRFRYTVRDSAGKEATGTVSVTIDAPPRFDGIAQHFDATPDSDPSAPQDAGWDVRHGTSGPLTGDITLSDAEGDPVTLVVLHPAGIGTVTLTKT